MGHTTTKKVRLKAADTARLARLAELMHSTESEVLRQGLDLVDQMVRRERGIERLKELAVIRGPDKERYAFR